MGPKYYFLINFTIFYIDKSSQIFTFGVVILSVMMAKQRRNDKVLRNKQLY